jgi:hypothetical protein
MAGNDGMGHSFHDEPVLGRLRHFPADHGPLHPEQALPHRALSHAVAPAAAARALAERAGRGVSLHCTSPRPSALLLCACGKTRDTICGEGSPKA